MCITVESPKSIIWNIFQKHENESVGPTAFIHPFMNPSQNTYVLTIYYVQSNGDPKERLHNLPLQIWQFLTSGAGKTGQPLVKE